MIEVKGVSKKLGGFYLRNCTFTIPAGYICGLVGPNGAGKTTLLHLLLGLYQAEEGTIAIDGMVYSSREKQIHDEIGTVLAEDLFEPFLTLEQNGDYYGKYYSCYNREQMEEYLKLFGLEKKRKFGMLSKGEKVKCLFAFALSHVPKLLILDEATGSFDPDFRSRFFEILKEYIADGTKSVILATHLTEDLDRIADYLIYLEEGNQIFAEDMETFRSRYRIAAGESYKIKLLPKERIVHMEENNYGAKALVIHNRQGNYDSALQVASPSIEEFMYFFSKRRK